MALKERKIILPGGNTCPGCAGPTIHRIIYNVLGEKVIQFGGGGCGGGSPRTIPTYSLHHSGVATGATGIVKALEAQGRTDITVIAMAGDGGASNTSFGKLSAAALRDDNMIFFTLDNEAYMNTGVQKSDLTPYGAWTRTTPLGKSTKKMNLPMIMTYHYIPYVATVTPAYHMDMVNKLKKAKEIEGFRYIHVLQPCPTGWRSDPAKSIELSRLAVQTGIWPLYEIIDGNFKITYKPREFKPVSEYLRPQRRFRHLNEDTMQEIQKMHSDDWERLSHKDGTNIW
jgi:pyruvate/2-oxoacid:ferredoxin oxidoreductase beta subunit